MLTFLRDALDSEQPQLREGLLGHKMADGHSNLVQLLNEEEQEEEKDNRRVRGRRHVEATLLERKSLAD